MTLADFLRAQEEWLIRLVLTATSGNVTLAERCLGMKHPYLFMRLRKLKIKASEFRAPAPKKRKHRRPRATLGTWQDHKAMMCINALENSNWNRAEAARQLGISYRTMFSLIRMLRERGIEVKGNPRYGD